MSELLILKRDWDSTIIRVRVTAGDAVQIDIPIDSFEKKLVSRVIEVLPGLATSIRKSTINAVVADAVRKAWSDITQDLKNDTIRVA